MNNNMARRLGGHLNIGEVKFSILEFILENKEHVEEPAIRKYLLKKYDVSDQSNINRHLHNLQEQGYIELIPPQKNGRSNQWNIKKLKSLKRIRENFPELRLHKNEKAINTIILEFKRDYTYRFNWLKIYIQLLLSVSFFDTCIEIDTKTLCQRIEKSYTSLKYPFTYKRINDLLKICYHAYAKYYSDFKVPEDMFTAIMKKFSVELIRFGTKKNIIEHLDNLPGLPEEIALRIIKTRLSETIEKIPKKIPDEINDKDFVQYMLHTLQLIMEQRWDYDLSIPYLLLEHFLIQDILIGVDSDDEHDFVKKTIENLELFQRWPEPPYMGLGEAELADLKLIKKIIIKYKQPAQLSDLMTNIEEVSIDEQRAMAKFSSEF
jgi:hypothetical protein